MLLPDVEQGTVILIGATTENPFFSINSPLVSRSRVFQFQPLSNDDMRRCCGRAMADADRGLGAYAVHMHEDALEFLVESSDGDARRALSALEVGVLSSGAGPIEFTRQLAEESVQRKAVQYDREGDVHYDSISALIKSIRGSDPDAALYWLARMLEGGEDVRFLARRLVILASEDVGNADPAGTASGRGRGPGLRAGGPARVPVEPRPGRDLPRLRAEVERGDRGDRRGPARRARRPAAARARPSPRQPLPRRQRLGHGKATSTPTTSPTRWPRRTTLAWSGSITGRSIAASRPSWPGGSRQSAPGSARGRSRVGTAHRRIPCGGRCPP